MKGSSFASFSRSQSWDQCIKKWIKAASTVQHIMQTKLGADKVYTLLLLSNYLSIPLSGHALIVLKAQNWTDYQKYSVESCRGTYLNSRYSPLSSLIFVFYVIFCLPPSLPVSIFAVYIILNSGISAIHLEVAAKGWTLFSHVSFLFYTWTGISWKGKYSQNYSTRQSYYMSRWYVNINIHTAFVCTEDYKIIKGYITT